MLKKIALFMQGKGLSCEKNDFYGVIDGVEVSGSAPSLASATISYSAHIPDEAMGNVRSWIEGNRRGYGIMHYSLDKTGFTLVFSSYMNVKKYLDCFELMLNVIRDNSVRNCCPFCGEQMDNPRFVYVNGRKFHSHENCFNEYVQKLEETEAAQASAPVKPIRGVLGALVGVLIGCVLWAVLYLVLGVLSAVAAVFTVYLAAFMWDKFGGKNCKTKIVVVWIATVVMLTLTMFGCYLVTIQVALLENNVAGTSFEWFLTFFNEDDEFRSAIILDTSISLLFIIGANIFTTVGILQTQKRLSKDIRILQ